MKSKADVAYLKVVSQNLYRETEKNHEKLVRKAGLGIEIRS
jgi:hypothetical protein